MDRPSKEGSLELVCPKRVRPVRSLLAAGPSAAVHSGPVESRLGWLSQGLRPHRKRSFQGPPERLCGARPTSFAEISADLLSSSGRLNCGAGISARTRPAEVLRRLSMENRRC